MKDNTHPCRVVVGLALGILVVFGNLSTVSGVIIPNVTVRVTPSCTPIQGGDFIWFNANFKPQGIPSTGATVFLTNSTISFMANKAYNVLVPNAQIAFSPSATCASTSFDSLTNTWMTTVPISGTDNIFLSGLAFPVPASFANVNGLVSGPVAWQGTFGTDTPGVSIQGWAWGAAVYNTCFTTNYNLLNVKPTHQNACNLNNGDQAGTPENRSSSVLSAAPQGVAVRTSRDRGVVS
jgi:hypothetical protein